MKMRISVEFTDEQLDYISAYYGLTFPAHRALLEDLVRLFGDPVHGAYWESIFKAGKQEAHGLSSLRRRGAERLKHERTLIFRNIKKERTSDVEN